MNHPKEPINRTEINQARQEIAKLIENYLEERREELLKEWIRLLNIITFAKKSLKLIREKAPNLERSTKKRLVKRIKNNVINFLKILVDLQIGGEKKEKLIQKALDDIRKGINFYSIEHRGVDTVDRANLVSWFREFSGLTNQNEYGSQISDELMEYAMVLLSSVRRWGLGGGEYASSIVDPHFEESDLMHVIKMMVIAKNLAKSSEIPMENVSKLFLVIILHDLPEALVGDISQNELDPNSQESILIYNLFKEVETQVSKTIGTRAGGAFVTFRELYHAYEKRKSYNTAEQPEVNRLHLLVRLYDKLDSLATVAAIGVWSGKDKDKQFYTEKGYVPNLDISIPNFWKAFEEYAIGVFRGDEPKITNPEQHLYNLLESILEFVETQYFSGIQKQIKPEQTSNQKIYDLILAGANPTDHPTVFKIAENYRKKRKQENPFDQLNFVK